MAVIAVVIAVRDGAPVVHLSERMKTPDESFHLIKFRTMIPQAEDWGVTGGHKDARITSTGAFLRRHRLDELPQLINILRGDISFVGPRPPFRRYVEAYPELYAEVLRSQPGVTGLATLVYFETEERLLSRCETPEETESVFVSRCIPRKARLDLTYARNRSVCYDMKLMLATVFRRIPLGARRMDRRGPRRPKK